MFLDTDVQWIEHIISLALSHKSIKDFLKMSCKHLYWYVYCKVFFRYLRIISEFSCLEKALLRFPKIILKRLPIATSNLRIKVPPWNYNTIRNNVRKPLVICKTQLAGGLLFKKLKYFEIMLNTFEFSQVWQNAEPWLPLQISLFELNNRISWLT